MIQQRSPEKQSKPRGGQRLKQDICRSKCNEHGKCKEMATPEIANVSTPPEISGLVRSTKIDLTDRLATMPAWALEILNDVKGSKWIN